MTYNEFLLSTSVHCTDLSITQQKVDIDTVVDSKQSALKNNGVQDGGRREAGAVVRRPRTRDINNWTQKSKYMLNRVIKLCINNNVNYALLGLFYDPSSYFQHRRLVNLNTDNILSMVFLTHGPGGADLALVSEARGSLVKRLKFP